MEESKSPIGWELERPILWILSFSDFPFALLFHPQHSCLVLTFPGSNLDWIPAECGTGLDGGDPLVSGTESSSAGGQQLVPFLQESRCMDKIEETFKAQPQFRMLALALE